MAWQRALARFLGRQAPVLDDVTTDELGAAVRALYGIRNGRRKRQRKRKHLTYRQRDQIAWLLIRIHRLRGFAAMTRAEWTDFFIEHMVNLSDFEYEEIADAAEDAATEQETRSGTEDANLWQAPAAAAQTVLNEWQADMADIEEMEAEGQDTNGDPRPRHARRSVRYPEGGLQGKRAEQTVTDEVPPDEAKAAWLPPTQPGEKENGT